MIFESMTCETCFNRFLLLGAELVRWLSGGFYVEIIKAPSLFSIVAIAIIDGFGACVV